MNTETVALARRLEARRGLAGGLSVQALILAYRGDLKVAGASISEAYEVFGKEAATDGNIFDYITAVELILSVETQKQKDIVAAAHRAGRTDAAASVQLLVPALLVPGTFRAGGVS